jgi:hypothetical protein
MASITLTFSQPIQDSVQIGDIAYFSPVSTVGGFSTGGEIKEIGEITALTDISITCTIPNSSERPSANDFILFSKDNRANMASIAGYYAEVEMVNNSTVASEIFHVSSEIIESSK